MAASLDRRGHDVGPYLLLLASPKVVQCDGALGASRPADLTQRPRDPRVPGAKISCKRHHRHVGHRTVLGRMATV